MYLNLLWSFYGFLSWWKKETLNIFVMWSCELHVTVDDCFCVFRESIKAWCWWRERWFVFCGIIAVHVLGEASLGSFITVILPEHHHMVFLVLSEAYAISASRKNFGSRERKVKRSLRMNPIFTAGFLIHTVDNNQTTFLYYFFT